MRCLHWSNCDSPDGGLCELNGQTLSFGCCVDCPDNTDPCEWPPEKKLDRTTWTSGKAPEGPCKPCARRQQNSPPNSDRS